LSAVQITQQINYSSVNTQLPQHVPQS